MILGLSTSGPYCGVALWHEGDVIGAAHEDLARGQAERLMPMISEVLAEAGVPPEQLQAIGVGTGPGNFTGIRISVAAARGLALGLGIPAVGIPLMDALSLDAQRPALVSLSAGRGAVYLQRFAADAGRGPARVALDALDGWAHPDLTCIGDQAVEIAAKLGARAATPAVSPAVGVARLAAARWQDAPAPPAPLYLRAADAAPARDAPPRIIP
ncbi:tRNA (adenosine(37)-N6)-threonylcarbamoyltransferase complex dimerization subunit type 1 TsaB [Sulfitobacter albidus]|uniref:tRNA (Adenosine(37)-N6)-threonylcarbamoyltransferase complex dimerization subunit type 1 TsaB n=1 Tax=Sulfitobacter albidus TaxID=2829501 RepID=A0A975JED7_9RHOB|nr:tRNA (adenosine(37)-N6)-threonylcarbamoyltransferase complex dimerization subunit type 1 TsaB [Sulfitobacter albidus]QUJ76913.1 tRNA (adenosine(37)-N6)-threonylcarbamoyltransferase complex dimerization subunit type 1 TsaB [Sulfitobacter albidus]